MYGKAADASIEQCGLNFLKEFLGMEDSPTTGSWDVGCYYKLTENYWCDGLNRWEPVSILYEEPWGMFKVKKGTAFLCHQPVLKIHKGVGGRVVDFRPHVRLVCRDPRFEDQFQFLTWDLLIEERPRYAPHCFKKITSPLMALALAANGLASEGYPD